MTDPQAARDLAAQLAERIDERLFGMQTPLRLVMVGIVTGSHVLIDDVPGVGKTTLVRTLASLLGLSFQRVQFTPDLMPTDITGTSILDMRTNDFAFRPGPLFAQVVLADEINRATPKTQAALLEAMQERQITVDGVSHPLPEPFFVLATQNPIELEGTFPLPEAQLDRFLLRVRLGYPNEEQEERILMTTPAQRRTADRRARRRPGDPRPAGPGRGRRARAPGAPLHRGARSRHARSPGARGGREPTRRGAARRRRASVGPARRPRLRPARRREAARRARADAPAGADHRRAHPRPDRRRDPARGAAVGAGPDGVPGRLITDTPERRRAAIGVAALAALLATAWGRTSALVWAAAVIAIAGGAAWWASVAWRRVTVDAWFEPARAFIGEPTYLVVRVENAKPRALPIVRISVRLPDGLDQVPDPEPTVFHGHRLRTQVDGDAETVLRFPVHPQHRGEFWLDRVDVELSDPFDLAPVRREIAVERPLLVMPGPRGGVPLRMRRWLPFGAPMPAARLFEDSEHFAGVRDYEPGDPMHHVHWRLSAHAGTLQTKTYEPTRSAEVLFALDLSDGEPFWERADAGIAEETIGMASYLARQAIHAGWRAGLVANTHLRRGRGPLRVTAASSAGQESVLFTALARMPNQPTDDLAPILREVGRRLTRRTTVVVLSANPGPSLTHEMERLRRRGSDVLHVVPSASETRPEAAS